MTYSVHHRYPDLSDHWQGKHKPMVIDFWAGVEATANRIKDRPDWMLVGVGTIQRAPLPKLFEGDYTSSEPPHYKRAIVKHPRI